MRRVLYSWFACWVAAITCPAIPQTTNSTAERSSNQTAVRGTLVAELAKSISARKARAGEQIEARVTMDLLSRGEIIIPRGTKIIGHIVSARTPTRQAGNATVEIAFDRMLVKKAGEIPLKVAIQALAAPVRTNSPNAEAVSDLDLAAQTNSRPAPGPNERRDIAQTTYPGTRGPANASGAGKQAGEGSGGSGNLGQSLGPASRGVIGIKGIELGNTPSGFAISSDSGKLRLESGTQLVLRILAP